MATTTVYTGPNNTVPTSHGSFDEVHSHLTSKYGWPVLPRTSQPSPLDMSLSHTISSLSVHPTLEALLHILNNDLPSAHFLCRHMQNEPAWEGMFIHGLLHRVEGDYRNAEAWYGNVAHSDVFKNVWPEGLDTAKEMIQRIESMSKRKVGDLEVLQSESRREIETLIKWCKDKFGTEMLHDGTTAWVEPSEEHRKMAAKMLTGGEGWRQF